MSVGGGSSSKEATVGYKYYLGVHMVICQGPIDKMVAIEVDDKNAWIGNHTGGSLYINKPDLFGGENREGGIIGAVDIDMGGPSQTKNSYLQARLGSLIPAYRGVVSVVLNQVYLGLNPYLKRWAFWAERIHVRQDGQDQWYGGKAAIGSDMNPAHILRECLTDPTWGMGYLENDIDETSFKAAADQLFSEQMGMSLLWDKGMLLEDFIKLVLKHIDASLYVDRTSGKFVIKLIRDDYNIDDLLVLDESSINKISNFKRNSISELVNSVTVIYWDASTGKNGSVTVQDVALVAQQRATISTTKQFPGFTSGSLASKVASRTLKVLSTPLASATIYANRSASRLNIGDVFILRWPQYGLVHKVMRVANIELGTLEKNLIKISCMEDIFSTNSAVYAAPPPSEWVNPNNTPAPCPLHSFIEAPYWDIVKRQGEVEAQSKAVDSAYILATGVRPTDDAINARFFSNPTNSGFEEVGAVDFCPAAQISSDVGYTDTIVSLVSAVDVDIVEAGSYAVLGEEIVEVIFLSDNSMTINRGCLDTVPQQHISGTHVFFSDAFYETDQVEYVINENARIKLLPLTGKGTLALDNATQQNLTMVGRLSKPYPPGSLALNGKNYPNSVAGDENLIVSWKHRDRLQQTASLIPSNLGEDIGPELNTTYSIKLLRQSGSIIFSQTGLEENEYTFILDNIDLNIFGRIRIKLSSHRDGIECFQSHDFEFTRAGYGAGYGYAYGGSL